MKVSFLFFVRFIFKLKLKTKPFKVNIVVKTEDKYSSVFLRCEVTTTNVHVFVKCRTTRSSFEYGIYYFIKNS